ncbi:PREDICTED: origin recognition complex subunit 2-like [Priapulus caudatus]|uniref:Origin recognition complex subunit 2 n=1 Tax=Priapulus caudatus TaxID=37621 RepID=A0ABM1EPX7_PRICU|nr:PREDICTED: origin recognition complex subunit 2-like [Priapulus caudatus]
MAASTNPKTSIVTLQFVGKENIAEHIINITERKASLRSAKKFQARDQARTVSFTAEGADGSSDDTDDYDIETELHKPDTLLEKDDKGISGYEVYAFETPKRSGQMEQKASESAKKTMTPQPMQTISNGRTAAKTPTRKGSKTVKTPTRKASKTPSKQGGRTPTSKGKGTPKQMPGRNTEMVESRRAADTPYRLRRLITRRVEENVKALDSDESDESDEDYDDKDDDDSSSNHSEIAGGESSVSAGSKGIAVATDRGQTPTSGHRTRQRRDDRVNPDMVEEYFDAHGRATVATSDRTLARLRNPRLDQQSLASVLKSAPLSHARESAALYDEHRELFTRWMFQFSERLTTILHCMASGSKRVVMTVQSQLLCQHYRQPRPILNSITEDVLGSDATFSNVNDQLEFIRQSYEEGSGSELYVVVHSVDGVTLRGRRAQAVLSHLAQLPHVHLLASIDHINAPVVWDQNQMSRFNWLWYDATTFEPYAQETSYENSLLVQQSGVLALSSLTHVFRSLTPNARGIFLLVATHQLEQKDTPGYIGLSFHDCYQKCREAFLVNSELTLRAQLTEFHDHKLMRYRKGPDGAQHLYIPLEDATLTEFKEHQLQAV